jgi:predicted PurR-regulated permease PerM
MKLPNRFVSQPWRISAQAWISLLLLGLVLWFTITHTRLIVELSALLFGSFLLSLGLHPLVSFLAKRRIPRGVGVIISYILILGVFALLGDLLVPVFNREISLLQTSGPDLAKSISNYLSNTPLLNHFLPSVDSLGQMLTQRIDTLFQTLVTAVAGVGGLAIDVLIVLFLTYFISTDPDAGNRLINTWFPDHLQDRIHLVVKNVRQRLSRWVAAQLFFIVYFTSLFSITLALLKVPFAFAIGLLGGILGIIPYVGGLVAMVLAILIALTVKPILALWIFIIFGGINEIQAHILAPAIYGKATEINTSLALISLLIGARLAGFVGVLFSIPVAVVLTAVLSEVQAIMSLNHEDSANHDDGTQTI